MLGRDATPCTTILSLRPSYANVKLGKWLRLHVWSTCCSVRAAQVVSMRQSIAGDAIARIDT
jgi:hypothetical protein